MSNNKVLVIIDIQNDYFEGGNFPLSEPLKAAQKAKLLLENFREKGFPVVHIQHINAQADAAFFASGSKGVEINDLVKPLDSEKIVIKKYPNSFRETELLEVLRKENATELVICGMQTNMCVDATVRAAADMGFKCTVVSDACAAANLQYEDTPVEGKLVHTAFLAALQMAYAEVIPLNDFLKK